VRRVDALAFLSVACCAATPADAQAVGFNIPVGRLGDALIALGQQAGITVGTSEPGLAAIRVQGLRGRMPVKRALARLLAGTGFTFSFVGDRAVRIARAPPRSGARSRRQSPSPPPRREQPQAPQGDIVVVASKQSIPLGHFAGTAQIVPIADGQVGRFGQRGSEMVVDELPMLASTHLGPGRNKIFARGIADSSFNGPTQSVVGQYLGDVRLTFNAPDPDLQLYDIRHVELLEGPQGTLYGTGALGGILRLVPNEPDPTLTEASASAGLLLTQDGDAGRDASAMFNLPLVHGRAALRAVGYASSDGGYIDNVGQGRRDVNRSSIVGGRLALLWAPGDGWKIEVGGLAQFISDRDGQYAEKGLPPLSRRSDISQPFDNDYALGHVTVRKRWGGIDLVSATGFVHHNLDSRFDATGFAGTAGTQLFTENVDITLFTQETRLSHSDASGRGWLVGVSGLIDVSRIRRRIGPPTSLQPLAGVRNEVTELALFGQYSRELAAGVVGTIGGRITRSAGTGTTLDAPEDSPEPRRTDHRFSPTAALSWQAGKNLLFYARAQQGFRAGGLSVASADSPGTVERFASDRLTAYEAGVRAGRAGGPLSLNADISYSRWSNIQADLLDSRGLQYTTNLGDGRIVAFETVGTWRASRALSFDVATFLSDSALTAPAPAFAGANERDLPNVPAAGARLAAHYQVPLSARVNLALDGEVRYVGKSQLGIGAPLDRSQGKFSEARLGGLLDFGRFRLSLDVTNIANTRGNLFSFGNPFNAVTGNQYTPLRPRTVRMGLNAAF
jgi:iron complex outermembrane receptor protein